jgi:hypothetical protein
MVENSQKVVKSKMVGSVKKWLKVDKNWSNKEIVKNRLKIIFKNS